MYFSNSYVIIALYLSGLAVQALPFDSQELDATTGSSINRRNSYSYVPKYSKGNSQNQKQVNQGKQYNGQGTKGNNGNGGDQEASNSDKNTYGSKGTSNSNSDTNTYGSKGASNSNTKNDSKGDSGKSQGYSSAVGSLDFQFKNGQCTDWADARYAQLTGHHVEWKSDAKNWANDARSNGWTVSSKPQSPCIIVLQPGSQGTGAIGHVAVVESINSDGSVYTSNYNFNGGPYIKAFATFKTGSGVDFIWHN